MRAGLAPDPEVAAVMSVNTSSAIALPIEAIAAQVEADGEHDRDDGGEHEAGRHPSAEAPAQHRRELADRRHLLAQARPPGRGRRWSPGRGEQRGDGHQPVAGAAEDRFGGDGERGAAASR